MCSGAMKSKKSDFKRLITILYLDSIEYSHFTLQSVQSSWARIADKTYPLKMKLRLDWKL